MNFLLRIIIFIANLPLGENFFIFIAVCLLLFSITLLLFSIVFKRLRLIKKPIVISATLLVYSLCIIKTLCQTYVFNFVDYTQLILCAIVAFFEILVLSIFCLLPTKNLAYNKDNEVIRGLFKNNDFNFYQRDNDKIERLTSKKIERLKTKKMFSDKQNYDFNVNYSYLLKRINSFNLEHLSSIEKAELFNLKTMIEQFSYKELTNSERERLCDGIRKFLKFSAKYDGVLLDKF